MDETSDAQPASDPSVAQRAFRQKVRRAAGTTRQRTTSAAAGTKRRIRRATTSGGAGETGLAKLIELHAVSAAGDALIAVSLAGTLFFGVPTGEARGKVALYLLITMAPFAVVAPILGPMLDRFRHGRRGAIGGSFALRAFLAWVMAGAVAGGGLQLYPAAFGVLVASKAYVITRSATVPRLLPGKISLVKANSRISLAGVVGVAVATPIGVLLNLAGAQWTLRVTFLVFVLGTILSVMLPKAMDSSAGEIDASVLSSEPPTRRRGLGSVGPSVVMGLRANAAIRGLSGFLTIYLLFLLRHSPVGGFSAQIGVAIIGISAVLGSTAGSFLGSSMHVARPEVIIVAMMAIAALSTTGAAIFYGAIAIGVVAGAVSLAQQLGKLSFDALVQRDVPEHVRSSAFARTETVLQLSWVLGGALGIALPLDHRIGFGVSSGLIFIALVLVAVSFLRLRAATRGAVAIGEA